MKNLPAAWRVAYSHCCNSSKLRCHIFLDSGNDKYENGAAKLPTDTISKWLNVIYVQRNFTEMFFLSNASGAYIRSLWISYGVARANIFCQWTKRWLKSLVKYFFSRPKCVLSHWDIWRFASRNSQTRQFLTKNISQCSVGTHFIVVGSLIITLLKIYYRLYRWQNFGSRSRFDRIRAMSLVPFWTWCIWLLT